MSSEKKKCEDSELWRLWLDNYITRIKEEFKDLDEDKLIEYNRRRVDMMNENNPKYVLRNYLANEAIERADNGDLEFINHLLKVLENPYNDFSDDTNDKFCKKPPKSAIKLKVSCSS